MSLQDVVKEIKETAKAPSASTGGAAEKPAKQEKPKKSRAEIEAYRQKKMAEEERKYLDTQGKKAASRKKKRTDAASRENVNKDAQKAAGASGRHALPANNPAARISFHDVQPLHMLHIPGLPDGSYLLVSLVTPK